MARRKPRFSELKEEYGELFNSMRIRRSAVGSISRVARELTANKHRYETISEMCGGNIPWEFIAIIHSLESGQNFHRHLHNGDSLRRRTRRVPANRPRKGNPPFTFEESATDALKMKGLHKIPAEDWTVERMLYEWENYNGWGYRLYHPSVLSAYLWAGTTHYTRGKYVRDGKWSHTAVSAQRGAAGLLKLLLAKREPARYSRKSRTAKRLDGLFGVIGGGGLLSWSTLHEVRAFMTDNAGILVLVVGGIAFGIYKYFQYMSNKDLKDGRYIPSEVVEQEDNSYDNNQ